MYYSSFIETIKSELPVPEDDIPQVHAGGATRGGNINPQKDTEQHGEHVKSKVPSHETRYQAGKVCPQKKSDVQHKTTEPYHQSSQRTRHHMEKEPPVSANYHQRENQEARHKPDDRGQVGQGQQHGEIRTYQGTSPGVAMHHSGKVPTGNRSGSKAAATGNGSGQWTTSSQEYGKFHK